jgi:hypothetical protein
LASSSAAEAIHSGLSGCTKEKKRGEMNRPPVA